MVDRSKAPGWRCGSWRAWEGKLHEEIQGLTRGHRAKGGVMDSIVAEHTPPGASTDALQGKATV